ncbi:hypothetical protein APHAL10511_004813 [Amanita phalloides]|nr:hypothetical protein APHAL10511_004813 [Amanita phalloides]
MSNASAQASSQQPKRQRKPLFADYPTIKILTPPQGKFSPKTDEWCFSYCSQSINGRIHNKEPYCRSVCIRKIFPHEVRNVINVKTHRNIGADGKSRYPLPHEGQPENIPKFLGGKRGGDPDEKPSKQYWDEGWYLWRGKGRWAAQEKTETMLMDLEQQQRLEALKERKREATSDTSKQANGARRRSWGYVVPRNPHVDLSSQTLLLPLPPQFPPFWDRISKLLAPTVRVLGILHESIVSGEQKKFAVKVWEKAWTDEPFVLASRTFTRAYERWKENEDERKDST